jgi:hypothetical protein
MRVVVEAVLQIRSMQTRRRFKLEDSASVTEFIGNNQNVVIRMSVGETVICRDRLDVQIIDGATGGCPKFCVWGIA